MRTVACAVMLGLGIAAAAPAVSAGQGTAGVGVDASEIEAVLKGRSAKKVILDKPVYNDLGEIIGNAVDIVISPKPFVSYLIVDVSRFVQQSGLYVAIPVGQTSMLEKRMVLPGATREIVKRMPPFPYTR